MVSTRKTMIAVSMASFLAVVGFASAAFGATKWTPGIAASSAGNAQGKGFSPPTNGSAGNPTSSSLTITWSAPSSGAVPSSYSVFRSATLGGTYAKITSGGCGAPATSGCVDNSGLSSSTQYFYEVFAVLGSNWTTATSSFSGTTASSSNTLNFTTAGVHTLVVPAGTTSVAFTLAGAGGSGGSGVKVSGTNYQGGNGGAGGSISGTINLSSNTTGETLTVYVGAGGGSTTGDNTGSNNGSGGAGGAGCGPSSYGAGGAGAQANYTVGGGGGGITCIYVSATPTSPIVIAGGGGGGAGFGDAGGIGNGGPTANPGTSTGGVGTNPDPDASTGGVSKTTASFPYTVTNTGGNGGTASGETTGGKGGTGTGASNVGGVGGGTTNFNGGGGGGGGYGSGGGGAGGGSGNNSGAGSGGAGYSGGAKVGTPSISYTVTVTSVGTGGAGGAGGTGTGTAGSAGSAQLYRRWYYRFVMAQGERIPWVSVGFSSPRFMPYVTQDNREYQEGSGCCGSGICRWDIWIRNRQFRGNEMDAGIGRIVHRQCEGSRFQSSD